MYIFKFCNSQTMYTIYIYVFANMCKRCVVEMFSLGSNGIRLTDLLMNTWDGSIKYYSYLVSWYLSVRIYKVDNYLSDCITVSDLLIFFCLKGGT